MFDWYVIKCISVPRYCTIALLWNRARWAVHSARTAIESRVRHGDRKHDWKYLRGYGCQGASSHERIVRFPRHSRQVYPFRKPFASDRVRLIVLPPAGVYSTQYGSTLIYRRYHRLAETRRKGATRKPGLGQTRKKKKEREKERKDAKKWKDVKVFRSSHSFSYFRK